MEIPPPPQLVFLRGITDTRDFTEHSEKEEILRKKSPINNIFS